MGGGVLGHATSENFEWHLDGISCNVTARLTNISGPIDHCTVYLFKDTFFVKIERVIVEL